MAPQPLQDSLDELIRREAIRTYLQPIVDLRHNQPVGYEALTRGNPGNMLQLPELMFQAANQFERIPELEALCIRSALQHFAGQQVTSRLFLNICPQTLFHYASTMKSLSHQLAQLGLTPADVVLEISERFPIDHSDTFVVLISELKALGYGIAIDDLGSGYSGLKQWSQIHPDFVKIDRHFIDRIDQDTVKQAFVTSVVHLSEQLNCEIIAEGIEKPGEMKLLRALGIHIGQGYLLGKPGPDAAFITSENHPATLRQHYQGMDQPIGALCQTLPTIGKNVLLKTADDMFRKNPLLMSLPVLRNNRPIGLLHKRKVVETFAQPYGRALYEKKSVEQLMQRTPLIVDCSMSLEAVSQLVTDDEDHYLRQHIIVTDQGTYMGLVNTKELLKRITSSQIQKARYANPLTMLPGNVLIDEHTDALLRQKKPFYLLYADLNHFKPFNDHYGYRQGDNVIRWLGQLLQSEAGDGIFVGHVGGDDFILISQQPDITRLCESILHSFIADIARFHTAEDWNNGCIQGTDRSGRAMKFPLLSLAIGVVPSGLMGDNDPLDLTLMAANAKKLAKKKSGNHWQILSTEEPVLSLVPERMES